MGIIAQGKDLWNALFTRTQRQVLGLLFGHPERSYYANEVVRLAGVGTGSTQRELKRLTKAGLLTMNRLGNQKHYQANRNCPIFDELRSIVVKTFGVVEQLRSALLELDPDLELALLFGDSFNDPQQAGLNLLLVSKSLEYADAMARLTDIENRIGRTLEVVLMTPGDFHQALEQQHTGMESILSQQRIVLHGSLDGVSAQA